MSQDAVEIVRAFQPKAGADVAQMLGRNADPEVVGAVLASVAPLVSDDFICAFNALGYGERRMADEVELQGGAIYTVRDGKIARAEYFAQRADAYAAAGFEPPD